jgi:hypothetical protein
MSRICLSMCDVKRRRSKCQKYFYVTHWQTNSWHLWLLYLYTFSLYENALLIIFSAEMEYISTRYWYRNINFQTCAAIYQLLLHMAFTSRNWFTIQGPVAIILISWNVIFIWETGYWTRALVCRRPTETVSLQRRHMLSMRNSNILITFSPE